MIEIRTFSQADLPFGLDLSRDANWNQTRDDWLRQLGLDADGCFLASCEGRAAGTVATCRFGGVGWISMMLVHQEMRRRGVGRALMLHALQYLEQHGAVTIRLDATPMGQQMYESLGFRHDFALSRYTARLPASTTIVSAALDPVRVANMSRIDQTAYGCDRGTLIKALVETPGAAGRLLSRAEGAEGYVLLRPGRLACFLGPCVASTPNAARELLMWALQVGGGLTAYVDVPRPNEAAVRMWGEFGFQPNRELLRMTRGVPCLESTSLIYATSGPEKG